MSDIKLIHESRELLAESGKPSDVWLKRVELFLYGQAKGPIWSTVGRPGLIGLRLDCGDSGVVYLTKEQAREVIDELKRWVG